VLDPVIGRKETSPALLTLDERLTRRRYIIKIPSRTAAAVREGMEKISSLYDSNVTNSILQFGFLKISFQIP
jgi:IS30 family transposase